MIIKEAEKNLARWRRWANKVQCRWAIGSPLYNLAQRRVLQAELKLMELQEIY